MNLVITSSLIFCAFALASCAGSPPASSGAASGANSASAETYVDPDFGPKCIQRIKAGLADPNTAEIDLSGADETLRATVTTTSTENGEKTYQTYVCKRDQDRAVIASRIAD